MQIGDVIHLDGLKAEYNFCGRDRFSACTFPTATIKLSLWRTNISNLLGPMPAVALRESIATG